MAGCECLDFVFSEAIFHQNKRWEIAQIDHGELNGWEEINFCPWCRAKLTPPAGRAALEAEEK